MFLYLRNRVSVEKCRNILHKEFYDNAGNALWSQQCLHTTKYNESTKMPAFIFAIRFSCKRDRPGRRTIRLKAQHHHRFTKIWSATEVVYTDPLKVLMVADRLTLRIVTVVTARSNNGIIIFKVRGEIN